MQPPARVHTEEGACFGSVWFRRGKGRKVLAWRREERKEACERVLRGPDGKEKPCRQNQRPHGDHHRSLWTDRNCPTKKKSHFCSTYRDDTADPRPRPGVPVPPRDPPVAPDKSAVRIGRFNQSRPESSSIFGACPGAESAVGKAKIFFGFAVGPLRLGMCSW